MHSSSVVTASVGHTDLGSAWLTTPVIPSLLSLPEQKCAFICITFYLHCVVRAHKGFSPQNTSHILHSRILIWGLNSAILLGIHIVFVLQQLALVPLLRREPMLPVAADNVPGFCKQQWELSRLQTYLY